MTCRRVIRLLTEDLQVDRESGVRSHLERCSRCREIFDDLKALEEMKRMLQPSVRAPEGFETQVIQAVSRASWLPSAPVIWAACCLLLVTLGLTLVLQEAQSEVDALSAGEAGEFIVAVESGDLVLYEGLAEESGSYVDIVLESPTDSELILRLPSTIEIRRTDLHYDPLPKSVSY